MAAKGKPQKAVAYLRTSSAANVGADKDSEKRQRAAIQVYAMRAGIEIVDEFYAAVSGADPIDQRRGFTDMLTPPTTIYDMQKIGEISRPGDDAAVRERHGC
jgi:hypothetical protein